MAVTSVDIDKDKLEVARTLVGLTSARATIDTALDALITQVRGQQAIARLKARYVNLDKETAARQLMELAAERNAEPIGPAQ